MWLVHEDGVKNECDLYHYDKPNNEKRKAAYRFVICEIYGYLGRGVRKDLPKCVLDGVRCLYPDKNAKYMGFRKE